MTDDKRNPLAPDCEECNGTGMIPFVEGETPDPDFDEPCEACDGTGRGAGGKAYLADCDECDGTGIVPVRKLRAIETFGGNPKYRCRHCDGTGKVKRDPAIVDKARELTAKITSKAKAAKEKTLQNTGRDDDELRVASPREALLRVVERHGFDLSAHARDVVCTGESFVMILPNDTPEEKRAEVEHDCNAVMPEGLVVYVQRRGGGQSAHVTATPLSPGVVPTQSASPPVLCVECGKPVEHARECYAKPTCYACLPPPEPLPECEPPKTIDASVESLASRLDDMTTRNAALDEIRALLPVLTKHEAQALLAKCDRGSQHCSECPAFGCCDNTAIRVREPGDHLVAMRERECVGVPVKVHNPITGEWHNGERGPVCEPAEEYTVASMRRIFRAVRYEGMSLPEAAAAHGETIPREPGPSPDDLPRPRATEPDDCKPCGGTGREGGYSARDNCPACRGTGKVITHESGGVVPPRPIVKVHEPTDAEREQGIMRADVSIPLCPLQPRLGSTLSTLLPKLDPRKTLDHVIEHAARGDEAVHEFLCKLRDKYDALDALRESVAVVDGDGEEYGGESFMGDEHVKAILGWLDGADRHEHDDTGKSRSVILPEQLAVALTNHLRVWRKVRARFYGALTRNNLEARAALEERDAYKYSAAYWWAHYQRAVNDTVPTATDPEVRALVPGVQDGAEWREAIEWALGVEPDPEEHTTEWARELVRAVREIGNKAHVESEHMRQAAREVFDPTKPARLVNADPRKLDGFCSTCGMRLHPADDGECAMSWCPSNDDSDDAKLREGIDPAAPTHDESGNPLSLGFLRTHFPAADKRTLIGMAAQVGATGDPKEKRTLSDMTPAELREHAAKLMKPRGPLSTRDDMKAALGSFGLEVVKLDDSDGKVTVHVSGSDPETLPAIERELQESMPATLRLSLVPVAPHPYR